MIAGLAVLALIAVGALLQGVSNLYWQLSWYLPS